MKNLKQKLKNMIHKIRDVKKPAVIKNNYIGLGEEEVAFEIGEMGFDKYGNLVKW